MSKNRYGRYLPKEDTMDKSIIIIGAGSAGLVHRTAGAASPGSLGSLMNKGAK